MKRKLRYKIARLKVRRRRMMRAILQPGADAIVDMVLHAPNKKMLDMMMKFGYQYNMTAEWYFNVRLN